MSKLYLRNNRTGAKIEMSIGRNGEAVAGGIGCLIILVLLALGPVIGSFTIPYCVNSWLIWAGKEPTFLWWYGALIGIIPSASYWSIVAAIITFILSFFF